METSIWEPSPTIPHRQLHSPSLFVFIILPAQSVLRIYIYICLSNNLFVYLFLCVSTIISCTRHPYWSSSLYLHNLTCQCIGLKCIYAHISVFVYLCMFVCLYHFTCTPSQVSVQDLNLFMHLFVPLLIYVFLFVFIAIADNTAPAAAFAILICFHLRIRCTGLIYKFIYLSIYSSVFFVCLHHHQLNSKSLFVFTTLPAHLHRSGLGFRLQALGFWVQGLGFRVQDLGFGLLKFRV